MYTMQQIGEMFVPGMRIILPQKWAYETCLVELHARSGYILEGQYINPGDGNGRKYFRWELDCGPYDPLIKLANGKHHQRCIYKSKNIYLISQELFLHKEDAEVWCIKNEFKFFGLCKNLIYIEEENDDESKPRNKKVEGRSLSR